MASVTPRPASSLTTVHARTHVAVAVKLLIVRAGRASALALALASQAKLLPLPFYTGPGSDVCLPVSSSHRPAPIHLAGPTCPPHPGKKTRSLSDRFLSFRRRGTRNESEREPRTVPRRLTVSLKKTQEPVARPASPNPLDRLTGTTRRRAWPRRAPGVRRSAAAAGHQRLPPSRASGIGAGGGAQVCARRNREKEVTAMARRFPGTRKLQRCH